jgi:hypothetical protein
MISTLRSIWRNDHLDVLVVDLHALQAVDILDLVDQVFARSVNALQAQDVVRIQFAVGDDLALLDRSPSNTDVAPLGNQLS